MPATPSDPPAPPPSPPAAKPAHGRRGARFLAYGALAAPVAAVLWPGLYASAAPELAGVPFFYWYQFLWVILGSALIGVAYRLEP